MNFTSDNSYGVSPEIIAALSEVNEGAAGAYGADETTARLTAATCKVFEKEVAIFPVPTGTGANALGLSSFVPSYGAVLCHEEAHINVNECNAVAFFTGGCELCSLPGTGAKLTATALRKRLAQFVHGNHNPRRSAVSITQPTELGTIYSLEEISAISEVCRENNMRLHMDGARFTNGLVSLDCSPADMTWKAGVDVLSFGATKNGGMSSDAVIFFETALAEDFERRCLQTGNLLSKGRFASAQLLAYLADDLWLRNARHANRMAAKLAGGLKAAGITLHAEVQANEVFAILPGIIHSALQVAGAIYYCWSPNPNSGPVPSAPGDVLARLVTSFATKAEEVDRFLDIASR